MAATESQPDATSLRRSYYWPPLLALAIFLASGQSQLAAPDLSWPISQDKLLHFLVFGLLCTSLQRTPRLRQMGWRGALMAALLTGTYGALDELRQSLTPGRQVELADAVADVCGALVASVCYLKWHGYRRVLELRCRLQPSANRTGQSACAGSRG